MRERLATRWVALVSPGGLSLAVSQSLLTVRCRAVPRLSAALLLAHGRSAVLHRAQSRWPVGRAAAVRLDGVWHRLGRNLEW